MVADAVKEKLPLVLNEPATVRLKAPKKLSNKLKFGMLSPPAEI